ncbi:hypothetical protein ACE6H2_008572 [Prunus campanulata]
MPNLPLNNLLAWQLGSNWQKSRFTCNVHLVIGILDLSVIHVADINGGCSQNFMDPNN